MLYRRYATVGVLMLALALQLCAIRQYGWFRDELYYVACGRRLALGYVDHPPLVAWLARAVEEAGGSLVALRILSVCSGLLVMAQAAWLSGRMGGGWFAKALAAFAVFTVPTYAFMFHYFSMNAFEVAIGTCFGRVLTAALERGWQRDWARLGLLLGVGCLTKYGVAFYAVALFVALAASKQRRVFFSAGPWCAIALAALIVAPHLAWQYTHGFPSLEFMDNARTTKNTHFTVVGYLVAQVTSVGPANAPLWIAGLVALLAKRLEASELTWHFGAAYLLLGAFFMLSGGKPYYLMLAYPPLLAAGAVLVEAWTRKLRKTLALGALAAYALIALLILPMGLPILPLSALVPYAGVLNGAAPKQERGRLAELPQHYADMFGWNELVSEVRGAVATLAPAEQQSAVVLALNYGEAAALEVIGGSSVPPVMSPHNAYFDWGPRIGSPVVAVGFSRERLLDHYEEVTLLATKRCALCMPSENDLPIYLCRRQRHERSAIWSNLKTYR